MISTPNRAPESEAPLFTTLRRAAELTGVSQATIRRLAAAGRLKLYRIGGRTVCRYEDLTALPQPRS